MIVIKVGKQVQAGAVPVREQAGQTINGPASSRIAGPPIWNPTFIKLVRTHPALLILIGVREVAPRAASVPWFIRRGEARPGGCRFWGGSFVT